MSKQGRLDDYLTNYIPPNYRVYIFALSYKEFAYSTYVDTVVDFYLKKTYFELNT